MSQVVVDEQAERDLLGIAHYIGVEHANRAAALRFLEGIDEKFELYATQPEMGTPRPELGDQLRSFTFKRRYVVVYRPLSDGIDVLRVFEGHRDYPRLFS